MSEIGLEAAEGRSGETYDGPGARHVCALPREPGAPQVPETPVFCATTTAQVSGAEREELRDAADRSQEPDTPFDAHADRALELIAYRVGGRRVGELEPAAVRRAWMDETDGGFASRCLPMLMANQAGWWLLNTRSFEAVWDGDASPRATRIDYGAGHAPFPAVSHFGYGIITFHVSMLMRTSPGWNLLVRGPANCPKDGVTALEGLVEADWAVATFTMNWKLTRPGLTVRFDEGEPICMLVPQRRGELERFHPRIAPAGAMPDLETYTAWRESRANFLRERGRTGADGSENGSTAWQRDYMRGTDPASAAEGRSFGEHQRRLTLRGFADPDPVGRVRRCAAPEVSRNPTGDARVGDC